MKINVNKPSYVYKTPFVFLGEEYHDSVALVEALLENWDLAVTAAKAEVFADFWKNHAGTDGYADNDYKFAQLYNRMWALEDNVNEDVLFSKMIHILEPAMLEIPFFAGHKLELELWQIDDYRKCFKEECRADLLYIIYEKNYLIPWEEECNTYSLGLVYLGQMVREKVFSCWGYTGAEDEILFWLRKNQGRMFKEEDWEQLSALYKDMAEKLYSQNEFIYQGISSYRFSDFVSVFGKACKKWNKEQWDENITLLFEQKEEGFGFLDWMHKIGETERAEAFYQWKMKWVDFSKEFPNRPSRKKMDFTDCLKYGTCSEFNANLERVETKVEGIKKWIDENNGTRQVNGMEVLYRDSVSGFVKILSGEEAVWSDFTIKNNFTEEWSAWKKWKENCEKDYREKKEFLKAVRQKNVLEYYDYPFLSEHELSKSYFYDNKTIILLLSCVPIKETYKEGLEKCKAFFQARGEGADDKKTIRKCYNTVKDLYFLKLLEAEAPGEIVADYMALLYELSWNAGVAADMARDSELKEAVRKWLGYESPDMSLLVSSLDVAHTVSKWGGRIVRFNRDIDYTEFHRTEKTYETWKQAVDVHEATGKKLIAYYDEVERIDREMRTYIDKNWRSAEALVQMKEKAKESQAVIQEAIEKTKDLKYTWRRQVREAGSLKEPYLEARKKFEEEWEERRKKKERMGVFGLFFNDSKKK